MPHAQWVGAPGFGPGTSSAAGSSLQQLRPRRATSLCGGRRAVDRLKSSREVPEKRRLLDDAVCAELFPVLVHLGHHFDHVVDVAPVSYTHLTLSTIYSV